MIGLTPRQHECLVFIAGYQARTGCSPSFENIAEELGLTSKGSITVMLKGLEERGYIRRLRNRARAIEVLKMPSGTGKPKMIKASSPPPPRVVHIPLWGAINLNEFPAR